METELRRIIDTLPGLIWTALPDGHVDFLNQRWCEYTGLEAAESYGDRWQRAVHAGDLPALLDRWRAIVASGNQGVIEARLRRFDGEYRWFELRACPLRDASGQVKWCGVNTDIEDRRTTEEGLRAIERRFRLVVDGLPAVVTLMTPEGELEDANRHMLEYFGATLEQLKARPTTESFHPDDRPEVDARWRRSVETGDPYDFEARLRRADGVYRWFHTRGFPLRDTAGRVVVWYLLQTDVDDRKRAEARKTAILNSALDCIMTMDHEGRITEFNPAAERTFGYRRDQVIGQQLADVIIPASLRERHRRGVARYLVTGEAPVLGRRMEMTAVRADGSEFPVELAITRIPSDGPPSFTGYLRDITERKRAEVELQRSEALLAEAQRLSVTGSFSWRVTSDLVMYSEQTYRTYDFDPSRPVTLEMIATRIHPDDLPLLREMVRLARGPGSDLDYEYRLQMKDGSIKHMHLVAHATRDRDGGLEYIGAIQDVTQRHLSETALGKARSELAHVARVTTLGVLTASIAHEVSQPLAGIDTNASTCLRMLDGDSPNIEGARETARRIIRDGNRACEVIARLRALYSNKDIATETLDLNEATREVIALTSSELKRNRVVLRSELADDLPTVSGDRVQLQQVILNLLRNASDAMDGVDDRLRQLLISTEREHGDSVRLNVRDAGVGVTPQNMNKVFDPFYTTKSDGMGIGLSVSRSIIEKHQGRLWAEANDGPGATFSFSIPSRPAMAPGTGIGHSVHLASTTSGLPFSTI